MDPELNAMQLVSEALEPLDEAARRRVLAWVASRLGLANQSADATTVIGSSIELESRDGFTEFADLFYAANPDGHAERALVASYWLSLKNPGQAFQGQDANTLLKDLGFQVAN